MINMKGLVGTFFYFSYLVIISILIVIVFLPTAVGSKEPPYFKVTLLAVLRAKVLGL